MIIGGPQGQLLRLGLVLFWGLVVFEGALRKWVAPQAEELIYVAKDVLVLFLLMVPLTGRGLSIPPVLLSSIAWPLLATYSLMAALEAANPRLPEVWVGLFGLKCHILYAGLLFLIPAAFPSLVQLERYLRWGMALSIPILFLGVIQFELPASHWLNQYVRESEIVAVFGLAARVRVTGTFSFISGMAVFQLFVFTVSLGLLVATQMRVRGNILLYAAMGLSFIVAPMNGSRGLVLQMAIVGIIAFLAAFWRKAIKKHIAITLMAVVIGAAAVAVQWSSLALEGLQYRFESNDDGESRIAALFTQPIELARLAGITGYGVGSTHPAASILNKNAGSATWLPDVYLEGESGRMMIELGVIGFVIACLLRLSLVYLAFLAVIRAGDALQVGLGAAAFAILALYIAGPIIFDATAGAFYWTMASVVLVILTHQRTAQRMVGQAPLLGVAPLPPQARPRRFWLG